jgi:serine/threonine-protein kinase
MASTTHRSKSSKVFKSTPPVKLPARYEYTGTSLAGGQGEVFVCTDTYLERSVAIKFLKDCTDVATLRNEIRFLSSVESKHVVQIYDLIGDSTIVGLVQEYIPGEDLWEVSNKITDLSHYIKILYQIASGIADIHAAGRIHRDIKPNNMKLDAEGIVKIFDFGLACEQEPDLKTTMARGTHGFRAPELYQTSPITFSREVDTYAFGVTAWVLGTGSLPDALQEVPPQSKTPVPSLTSHPLKPPKALADILDRTLSTDPGTRPAMADVRDAIARRLLHGQHQGCLLYNGTPYKLSGAGKGTKITVPGKGGLSIYYSGASFRISELTGDISINGIPAQVGQDLPGSCVIIIGSQANSYRDFITFDISHPEVVL